MGRGIGTALMQGFCNRAADSGATVVGLETSLAVNVQIYEKQGFLARGIRLLAVKDLAAHPTAATAAFDSPAGAKAAGDLTVMPWSAVGQTKRTPLIVAARKLAGMVTAGLDHTAEFDVAQTGGMGATYVALDGQGRLAGYAVLFLRGYRCPGFGDAQPPVDPLLWISVGSAEATEALLAACESAAARAGAAHLKVPCYSGNPHSWAVLRRLGYRPEAAFVRMFWRGQYGGTADRKWGQVPIDLSSWLG
jgi:GNAT superfamily N-acetyltransferase